MRCVRFTSYISVSLCCYRPCHESDSLSPYSVLKNIQLGQLTIITTAGRTHVFGASTSSSEGSGQARKRNSRAVLRVLNDVFWIRLCCMGDLGFSEAYMFGEVECPDLIETFKVSIYFSLAYSLTNILC